MVWVTAKIIPMPWFTDLIPTSQLRPVRKKKKSKTARKMKELLLLRVFPDHCDRPNRPKQKVRRRKLKLKCKEDRPHVDAGNKHEFEELLKEFAILDEEHPVKYLHVPPKPKRSNKGSRILSKISRADIPLLKVASNSTSYKRPPNDIVSEAYWDNIIQKRLLNQNGKPTLFDGLTPEDSLKLLRCGDVHSNPGPPTGSEGSKLPDNQCRWVLVGRALVAVVMPSLRLFLDVQLKALYEDLRKNNLVHTQTYGSHRKNCPYSTITFNYKFINGNDSKAGKLLYDYNVYSYVDLAKLYLHHLFMTKFSSINDECDPSAVLNLLERVPGSKLTSGVKDAASKVREDVRNSWAHCNLNDWDSAKFDSCFQLMDDLLKQCGQGNASVDLNQWAKREVKSMDLKMEIAELRTDIVKWKTVGEKDMDEIVSNLDGIVNSLKRLEQGQADIKNLLAEIPEKVKEEVAGSIERGATVNTRF